MVDVEVGCMCREGFRCGGRVDVEGGWMWRNLLISQYDHISAFFHCISLEGRVDVEKSSVCGCLISQYDHISAIFHCIALIFCMHQYFLKM